ncbi:MAG: hypothetical protein AAF269_04185 [Pseudomonadota bacterium]
MKPVKALLIAALATMVVGGTVWHFWLKPQVPFAQVATAYVAKQVCSCQFVAEREFESCLGDFTEDVSAINFEVSQREYIQLGTTYVDATVTASVLGGLIKNRARYEPGLGCAVVKS